MLALAGCGDVTGTRTAPDQPLLAFNEEQAVSANGDYPAADPLTVCGANDRRFLVELVEGSPLNYKIAKRLADIKSSPSEVRVSGVAADSSLGSSDLPFDHTFGSDFNMDVTLDKPYASAAQGSGVVIQGDLHVELAEGQLPHEPAPPGPASGQNWADMSARARQGILARFVPEPKDRVIVMGHWIVDCGHTNFDTELHPLTFMASGRAVGDKTVVNAFYNPYRETQLYHYDPSKAVAFDDPSRLTDSGAAPFPRALITNVLRLQNLGPISYPSIDHLESWALLEANRISPVEWRVCAPRGSVGSRLEVKYQWITRPGVHIEVAPEDALSCAMIHASLGSATIAPPPARVCVLPWDYLNEQAGAEAGIEDLDLQAELGAFLAPQYRDRLDPAPIVNCYDPLFAPGLEAEPNGQKIEVRDDVLLPFYGTISVELVG